MFRIMVCSDTHGDKATLRKALIQQPKAEIVIHLGDGAEDVESVKVDFPDKMFLQARGNCDFGSFPPNFGVWICDGLTIFFTHGHLYQVKLGLSDLRMTARDRKADIVLFGHTHAPLCEYDEGLYFINPGSLRGSNAQYATLDFMNGKVAPNLLRCR